MNKLFILGPCAAESREQVIQTAESLTASAVFQRSGLTAEGGLIYRSGLWKPRTSPSTFQGVGEEGLPWLQEVSETYNLPVATEVATPEHVRRIIDFFNSKLINEAASLYGLPIAPLGAENSKLSTLNLYIWIGARTSANPIAVQTIADEIQSTIHNPQSTIYNLPSTILIKNPVNEDVNLWIGNIERLQATGLPVMAIHRGCNHKPCWAMAFELRRRLPQVPLLLDPSHMSGDAAQVPALCQLAMDLDYDGLMIEVHNDPVHALSDAKQQLTPAQAIDVISHLHYREEQSTIHHPQSTQLAELRSEIDELDDDIWSLIAKRIEVAKRIGEYKREHNIPVLQAKRYDEVLQRRLEWAKKNGVSADAVQSILESLHNECVSVQL